MDYDCKYPDEGSNLVCYFEDASYSIVSEKDQLPFDTSLPPYTTYMQSSNSDSFQKDKAVALATMYFDKGIIPPMFKWLRNDVSTDSMEASSEVNVTMDDQDGPEKVTIGSLKRQGRKESVSGIKWDHKVISYGSTNSNSNIAENGALTLSSDTTNSTKKDSHGQASSGGYARRESVSNQSKKARPITSVSNKQSSNSSTSSSSAKANTLSMSQNLSDSCAYQNKSLNQTKSNNISNKDLNNDYTFPLVTSPIPVTFNSPSLGERITTFSSRSAKVCWHCGENARDGGGEVRVCLNCNEIVNAMLNYDKLNQEDAYWKYVDQKKRRYPGRLWGTSNEGKVDMKILNSTIPLGKRKRWIKRYNESFA